MVISKKEWSSKHLDADKLKELETIVDRALGAWNGEGQTNLTFGAEDTPYLESLLRMYLEAGWNVELKGKTLAFYPS